ncbi:hypothetical protein, partial [Devosia sp.]|uniref:hypothetical protein n=1 Tax=Devosia sp. TaxID=1871048 RepID=UPI0035B0854E
MSSGSETKTSSRWAAFRQEIGRAGGALLISLLVTFVIVLLTSKDPLGAFEQLLTQLPQKTRTFGYWIDDVAKLT